MVKHDHGANESHHEIYFGLLRRSPPVSRAYLDHRLGNRFRFGSSFGGCSHNALIAGGEGRARLGTVGIVGQNVIMNYFEQNQEADALCNKLQALPARKKAS